MIFGAIFVVVWICIFALACKRGQNGSDVSEFVDHVGMSDADKEITNNGAMGHPEYGSVPMGWCVGKSVNNGD